MDGWMNVMKAWILLMDEMRKNDVGILASLYEERIYIIMLLYRLKRTLLLSPAPHLAVRRPRRSGLLRRSRIRPITWLFSTSPPMNVCSRKFLPTSLSLNPSWLTVLSLTVLWLVLLSVNLNLKVWSSLFLVTMLKSSTVSLYSCIHNLS